MHLALHTQVANHFFVGPAEAVNVIGFPFGLKGPDLSAVWATGFMATEPSLDYDNLP